MSNASLPVGLICKNFGSLTPPCQSAWFEKSTPWPPYQRAWCKLYFVVIPGARKEPKTQEAPKCKKRAIHKKRKKRHKAKHKALGEHLENFGKTVRKGTARLWKDPRRSREGSGRSREDSGGLRGGPGRPQQGSEDPSKAPGVPGKAQGGPGKAPGDPGGGPGTALGDSGGAPGRPARAKAARLRVY